MSFNKEDSLGSRPPLDIMEYEALVEDRPYWERSYLNLMQVILDTGDDRVDRTGVGTRALFGQQLKINLAHGFPAMTTKKLAWKAVVSELLWFLEGSGDERRLAEILHGTRDPAKKTIWTANAEADYWKPKAQFEGDLGRVYGAQWRHWRTYQQFPGGEVYPNKELDQVSELVHKLKTNPTDRRMIISAWNVGELDQMALPPCHMFVQFFVSKGKLSCMMTQRSADVAIGTPFNVASYALLTHLLAQVSDLEVGELIINNGDTHLYHNHFDGVKEQLTRTPYPPPTLWLNPDVKNIDDFTMDDIKLVGYESHPAIKMEMAV